MYFLCSSSNGHDKQRLNDSYKEITYRNNNNIELELHLVHKNKGDLPSVELKHTEPFHVQTQLCAAALVWPADCVKGKELHLLE